MSLLENRKEELNSEARHEQGGYASIDSVELVDRDAPKLKPKPIVRSLRFAYTGWIALTIMSLTGVVAVTLHFIKNNPEVGDEKLVSSKPKIEGKLSEEPVAIEVAKSNTTSEAVGVNLEGELPRGAESKDTSKSSGPFQNNIQMIAKRCAKMVTNENSFAVFEHGTCVLLIEPIEDPVLSAKSTLRILSDPNMKFEVRSLHNNNYLVVFDKYLFCWLFADQIARNKKSIMSDPRLGREDGDSLELKKMSEINVRIGKLARLCLLEDSKKLSIQKLIRAKRRVDPMPRSSANPLLRTSPKPADL